MMSNQAICAFSNTSNDVPNPNVFRISSAPTRKTLSDRSAKWNESVVRRLNELVSLDWGWDGYQGVPVTSANAVFALQMIEAICNTDTPAPQIVPGSNGDLQIEWHTLNGDIELHVLKPNNVHAWHATTDGNPDGEECNLTNDFAIVAGWVKEITELAIDTATAAA